MENTEEVLVYVVSKLEYDMYKDNSEFFPVRIFQSRKKAQEYMNKSNFLMQLCEIPMEK